MEQQDKSCLRFVFLGWERDWNPMKDHEGLTGRVCELRSIPGDLVAWAPTVEEAEERLQDLLELAFKKAGSPSVWYGPEFNRLSDEDRRIGREEWGRLFDHPEGRVRRFAEDEAVSVSKLTEEPVH